MCSQFGNSLKNNQIIFKQHIKSVFNGCRCSCTMTTVHECMVSHDCDLLQLQQSLQQHVIVFNPPWTFSSLLQEFVSTETRMRRRIQITVNHSSRNVSVTEDSLSPPVLQTVVGTFKSHRLSPPVLTLTQARQQERASLPRRLFLNPLRSLRR